MQPTLKHGSSNDAVWSKEVPFGDRIVTIYLLGVSSPKNRQYFGVSREIQAKTRLLNNFLTGQDTP